MKPLISVIMPMYGVEPYIGRAIESVRQQTFTSWELLIVNDGTKDRSRDIAAKYESQDQRIRIIDKTNGGLTSARLKGLEYAVGDYLAFIDSDDTLQSSYLDVLYANIKKYDADVCMCSYNTVVGANTTPHYLYFEDRTTIIEGKAIFQNYFLPQIASIKRGACFLPSFMWLRLFKKSIVTADLFVSERAVYQEDLVFSARIVKTLERVVVINEPLYNYFVNSGSLTQKYRDNAWQMMSNLANEVSIAFKEYPNELTIERKYSQIFFAVHFTLMNASRMDFHSFKKEFRRVRGMDSVREALRHISLMGLKPTFIVLLVSLKVKCPYISYLYNKKRL